MALSIEATLPLPQIFSNYSSRSCRGFRFSVLASWIFGDVLKMIFFFFAENEIPRAFKLCGVFQFACDLFLGLQYWMYRDGLQDVYSGNGMLRAPNSEKNIRHAWR